MKFDTILLASLNGVKHMVNQCWGGVMWDNKPIISELSLELHWDGKESLNSHCCQFKRMARLGLVIVEDGILESCMKMMAIRKIKNKFHIPCGYGYIWQLLLA